MQLHRVAVEFKTVIRNLIELLKSVRKIPLDCQRNLKNVFGVMGYSNKNIKIDARQKTFNLMNSQRDTFCK